MRFDKPPRTLVTQGGRCAAPFQFRHFDELLLDMGAKVDAWTTTWLTPPGPGAFAGYLASAPKYRATPAAPLVHQVSLESRPSDVGP